MLFLINEYNVGARALLRDEISYLHKHEALANPSLAGNYLYQALADVRSYSFNIEWSVNVLFHSSIISYSCVNLILFVNYT